MPESESAQQHALQDGWFWHVGCRRRGSEFELKKLASHRVHSIESFWWSFNSLPSFASLRAQKANLYLFKDKVQTPMTEDPENMGGGRWVVDHAPQPAGDDSTAYRDTWMHACMFAIGNNMSARLYAAINGVVCNYQAHSKNFRLELWIGACRPPLTDDEMAPLQKLFTDSVDRFGLTAKHSLKLESLMFKKH